MNKILRQISIVAKAVASIAFVFIIASCQEKKMDRFVREAQNYTKKSCPQKLDEITTLDSMVFIPSEIGHLKMCYTLELDSTQRQAFMDVLGEIGDENLSMVKNSVHFLQFMEAGVDISFVYTDKATGDELVRYDFTKDDYK